MWARVENNNIVEYYKNKKSLVLNNVRYSSQIFTIWTDEERAELGIYSVIEPSHVNSKFHYESNVIYTFNEEQQKVIGTIETIYDHKLEDKDAVDEDENPVLDDHNNQVVILGLKSKEINKVKEQSNYLIKGFDWLTQRKVTADTDIPEVVVTYIANVREKCEEICTAIMNVSTMDEFKVLFQDERNEDRTLKTIQKRQDFPDDYYVKGYRR
jgi:hypothetical protein